MNDLYNPFRTPAVERAARLKDVTDRARAAAPVEAGRDILAEPGRAERHPLIPFTNV
jgi:hypothetical protein